jgi:hypothetical protein
VPVCDILQSFAKCHSSQNSLLRIIFGNKFNLCTTSVQPLYNLCTTSVQPLYNLCTTSVQPLYNLSTTSAQPLYNLCTTSVQPLYNLCTTSPSYKKQEKHFKCHNKIIVCVCVCVCLCVWYFAVDENGRSN